MVMMGLFQYASGLVLHVRLGCGFLMDVFHVVCLWFPNGCVHGCPGQSVIAKLPHQLTQFALDTPWIPKTPKLTDFRNFRNCEISSGLHLNSANSEDSKIQPFSEPSEFRVG